MSYSKRAKEQGQKLSLGWFAPRNCWRKYRKGKMYYFQHPDTREGYERALGEWIVILQQEKEDHLAAAEFLEEASDELNAPSSDVPFIAVEDEDPKVARAFGRVEGKRAERAKAKRNDKRETTEAAVARFVAFKMAQAESGMLSDVRANACRMHLGKLLKWENCPTFRHEISEQTLQDFYLHLLSWIKGETYSRTYAFDVFVTFRQFVRWALPGSERPYNLSDKFPFKKNQNQKKITFTVDEFNAIRSSANERTELFLLLMLNCGMTQKDISDLLPSEVDWKAGYIARKRSKTREDENDTEDDGGVPLVKWKLWRRTFTLLKNHGQRTGERVFVNDRGGYLLEDGFNREGKYYKNDNIKNAYWRVINDRMKLPKDKRKPLKAIRKTAASKLSDHKDYKFYSSYFLDHSPRTVAQAFYVNPSQEEFDAAVKWLGQQFGIE